MRLDEKKITLQMFFHLIFLVLTGLSKAGNSFARLNNEIEFKSLLEIIGKWEKLSRLEINEASLLIELMTPTQLNRYK